MELRVATYNIHKCIGGIDRRYRPERVLSVLQAAGADVVLLQEVDDLVPRSNWDRQVDLLGDALGFAHRAYFPNVRVRSGHYGNAVLSRRPIRSACNIDLTLGWRKPRSALHVEIEAVGGGPPVHLFNVHLGLSERERRWQVDRLLAGPFSELGSRAPVIVGGDLNDVFGTVRRRLLQAGGFEARPIPRTFPAFAPARALDGIYVRGARLEAVRRVETRSVRTASDHIPLVAHVGLRPRGPAGRSRAVAGDESRQR